MSDELLDAGSDAAAIISTVERLVAPALLDLAADGNNVAALPTGIRLESLKKYRDESRAKPERTEGLATLTSLASFIDHVNRFKKGYSAVFATEKQLLAVYDYHDALDPNWCKHLAQYRFPVSIEWKAWAAADGRQMAQGAFAEFLEQHVSDVTTPNDQDGAHFGELNYTLATPAQLLGLSRGLMVRVEMEAVAKPNLSSGESEVSYKEQHADSTGAPLKVPGGFMLLIPPFDEGPRYRIPVRLRYRVQGGKVMWSIHLHRAEAVIRDATKDACEETVEKTSVALFHGKPERGVTPRDSVFADED